MDLAIPGTLKVIRSVDESVDASVDASANGSVDELADGWGHRYLALKLALVLLPIRSAQLSLSLRLVAADKQNRPFSERTFFCRCQTPMRHLGRLDRVLGQIF